MFANLTGYNVSLWIHICAAVVGLGATFAEAILFQVAMRMDPRNMPFVHRAQRAINQRLANPALLVILVTGVIQVLDSDYIDFSDAWISASFVIIIVLGGLLGGYFIPTDKKLEAQAAEEIAAAGPTGEVQFSQGYLEKLKQEGLVGTLSGVLIIVVIFLMVVKPGA
jgi:uncharacterized membrane protein